MSTKEELAWAHQYFSTVNYLAAASIYLKDNFLLERKLRTSDIKESLLGHWGTCPGINFIYTHLNLLVQKHQQRALLVTGPGHGAAAILANQYLEGSLRKYYPRLTPDSQGIGLLIKSFCWPGGFPSHINPGMPGVIHEGGELGYALGTAFGAAFDNPDLLVVAIVGDGEAETGPTAAAWHSTKFLNPSRDGAVLPIVHLNSYKISTPSLYGTMSDYELRSLFKGYGYEPFFVGTDHHSMIQTLENAYALIQGFRAEALSGKVPERLHWPVIILKTPKGWTGIKKMGRDRIEGSYRSHQVPARDAKISTRSLRALEKWLRGYKPARLFPKGLIPESVLKFVPQKPWCIGDVPHAIGGIFRKALLLPHLRDFEFSFKKRGTMSVESAGILGNYLREVFVLNEKNANFRIFSPDELTSNKLDAVLNATGRAYMWPHSSDDSTLSSKGRVMEILSEHTLQSWFQGYVLTGRHGVFPSYEAFLPIIDSMISQYLKFLELSGRYAWRKPIPSLNYLVTSVCWRQDHNGFSHQNPGFISTLLTKAKEEHLVRAYFPADANMLLAVVEEVLHSTNRVNLIVSDKQMMKQWLSLEEAAIHLKTGAAIWKFASAKNPDIVLAACGDYQTQELLATVKLLNQEIPELKVQFVNVSELNVLGKREFYPRALDEKTFSDLFPATIPVLFSFHGYPATVKQLLFDRPGSQRFFVYGYIERGATTTPFDMLVKNNVSRYHFAIRAIEHAARSNSKIAKRASAIISKFKERIGAHAAYILKNGQDPEEINGWKWE